MGGISSCTSCWNSCCPCCTISTALPPDLLAVFTDDLQRIIDRWKLTNEEVIYFWKQFKKLAGKSSDHITHTTFFSFLTDPRRGRLHEILFRFVVTLHDRKGQHDDGMDDVLINMDVLGDGMKTQHYNVAPLNERERAREQRLQAELDAYQYAQAHAPLESYQLNFTDWMIAVFGMCFMTEMEILEQVFIKFDSGHTGLWTMTDINTLLVRLHGENALLPRDVVLSLTKDMSRRQNHLDFDGFKRLVIRFPILVWPLFRLQDLMRRRIMGWSRFVSLDGRPGDIYHTVSNRRSISDQMGRYRDLALLYCCAWPCCKVQAVVIEEQQRQRRLERLERKRKMFELQGKTMIEDDEIPEKQGMPGIPRLKLGSAFDGDDDEREEKELRKQTLLDMYDSEQDSNWDEFTDIDQDLDMDTNDDTDEEAAPTDAHGTMAPATLGATISKATPTKPV